MVHPDRIFNLKQSSKTGGNVVYWMSRDQRSEDNWALLHARQLAKEFNSEVAVVFCLVDQFLNATIRQYEFMLEGLSEVAQDLQLKNIPFYLRKGNPVNQLSKFIEEHQVTHLITDFDPLRIKKEWRRELAETVDANIIEIDTHNIVPVRIASNKQEFAAYTFRPKIQKKLDEYLVEFPVLETQSKTNHFSIQQIDWGEVSKSLKVNRKVPTVDWLHPGESSAIDMLTYFISEKIDDYAEKRNDPNADTLSNLSPYFHFGQLAPQRAALEIMKIEERNENTSNFLEELIVRRELAENYCMYNPDYDQLKNLPDWASKTIANHRKDERTHIYQTTQFEMAGTHDPLWNAAQNEMIQSGKMHGYMRMYWAKKILEWSESPEDAFKIAIYLNDKYELDGRDPNGYTGCAWAIAGVHDRAWAERPVFGKIRYMNDKGAKRKFDVQQYINKWTSISSE